MLRKTLWAAGAVLIAMAITAPAEARRSKAVATDRDGWSEETERRPARRSTEARNFWETDEEAAERPTRRSRRVASVASYEDTSDEQPVRRRQTRHVSSDDEGSSGSYSGGVGPRPSRWCGWWMRTQRGGGPELNLAWNWSKWGSPSGPQVGAVVVWPHHVGEITGQTADGRWIVRSGNDGGQVRERARSVAGAVFRVG